MATGKRYYWLKLKESFMTGDTIDFLMSQPNGAQYVVLYEMLCLRTINTEGKLEARVGEVLIPFDVAKIARDMKWFTEDTIRVAMQLYQQFGLIYTDENGVLVMADHNNLVGSETDYAPKKKLQRENRDRQKKLLPGKPHMTGDSNRDNPGDISGDNVPTDIDIRDRYRDKEEQEEENVVAADDPDGLREISEDHNDILNAAEKAGFDRNEGTWERIIELYGKYGKDAVLEGIRACLDQKVPKLAYLRACCQRITGEKKRPKEKDPFIPDDLADYFC